jgi:hypothetical protein
MFRDSIKGFSLARSVVPAGEIHYFNLKEPVPELDLDHPADSDLFASLGCPAINFGPSPVTDILGQGSLSHQTDPFEEDVKSHNALIRTPFALRISPAWLAQTSR